MMRRVLAVSAGSTLVLRGSKPSAGFPTPKASPPCS
jgi:hypothetical protein